METKKNSRDSRDNRGFTLIEMMLALVTFLLLMSMVLVFVNGQRIVRRDVTRMANMDQLQKAFEVYALETGSYPEGDTCLTGTDTVIMDLISHRIFDPDVRVGDPRWPDDLEHCYLYTGGGSSYTLRFYLETDEMDKGKSGYNFIRP